MKLIYEQSGKEVKVGDIAKTFRGEEVEVAYFSKPHKPSSEGKILVKEPGTFDTGRELYVGVIGAEWIEREDRGES